jgi:hypothetical protein
MAYLTGCNAVRTNGSATATQAANASDNLNEYMGNLVSYHVVYSVFTCSVIEACIAFFNAVIYTREAFRTVHIIGMTRNVRIIPIRLCHISFLGSRSASHRLTLQSVVWLQIVIGNYCTTELHTELHT